jgi:hypothetical protein
VSTPSPTPPPTPSPSPIPNTSNPRVAAIVGSVVGVLVLLGIFVAIFILRKRRRNSVDTESHNEDVQKTNQDLLSTEPGSPPWTPNSITDVGSEGNTPSHHTSFPYTPFVIPTTQPMSYAREELLPGYADARVEGSVTRSPTISPIAPIRESVIQPDDELGRWAAENRYLVPDKLEKKLRAAQYLPSDNPNEISPDVWRDTHGVGHFELKRLQELYAR